VLGKYGSVLPLTGSVLGECVAAFQNSEAVSGSTESM
jgi:hypothetical protein